MNNLEVITIGESMVVFNSIMDTSFIDSPLFIKQIAGAESNFAIGLGRLGHRVGWISRLSNDSFGNYINHVIRGNGVDTSQVQFDDEHPTGLLIKERLIQNQTNVHYYRKNSAASFMTPSIISEDYFRGAKFLFVTGITPALSETCEETIFKAIEVAKKSGIKVIFDPNVRFKLINDEDKYKCLLNEITRLSDYFLPGMNEAMFLSNKETGTPEKVAEHFINVNKDLTVIIKLGAKGCYYANEDTSNYVPGFQVEKVIDPVGAGDGFAAGMVSGLLKGMNLKEALEQANLIGSMLVQTSGDVEGFPFKNDLNNFKKYISEPARDEVNR